MASLLSGFATSRMQPVDLRAAVIALAVVGGGTSAPIHAQGYAAKTIGAWTVSASKDGRGCFVTRRYDGPGATTLLLGIDADAGVRLTVLNDNWSIAPRQTLTLTFRLTRGGYGDHPAIGIASDGKRGFVATFDAKFPDHVATSQRLEIYRGTTPVERLDMAGSGAAVAEMRRCVAAQGAIEAGERSVSDIPKDPFASESPRRSKR